jgi:hypothetical protein
MLPGNANVPEHFNPDADADADAALAVLAPVRMALAVLVPMSTSDSVATRANSGRNPFMSHPLCCHPRMAVIARHSTWVSGRLSRLHWPQRSRALRRACHMRSAQRTTELYRPTSCTTRSAILKNMADALAHKERPPAGGPEVSWKGGGSGSKLTPLPLWRVVASGAVRRPSFTSIVRTAPRRRTHERRPRGTWLRAHPR